MGKSNPAPGWRPSSIVATPESWYTNRRNSFSHERVEGNELLSAEMGGFCFAVRLHLAIRRSDHQEPEAKMRRFRTALYLIIFAVFIATVGAEGFETGDAWVALLAIGFIVMIAIVVIYKLRGRPGR